MDARATNRPQAHSRTVYFAPNRPAIPAVLDLMAAGRLAPGLVTAGLVAWDDAPEALAEHTAKLVVTRQAAY